MATHFRACNLCEAICGLEIETDGPHVLSIRGDGKDPLSHGYLCPKGVALQDVHEDENRLRHPIRKTAANGWEEVSWEAAFGEIAARSIALREQSGSESVAVYLGNPTVHNHGSELAPRHSAHIGSGNVMATHFRACNLCEAICGLEIETDGPHVLSIRGDGKDPLSGGYLCPKGVALQDVHEDENRLRHPIRKTAADGWEEVSWEAAFGEIAARSITLREQNGSESVAVYLGNPTVHNYGSLLFSRTLVSAIGRPQLYSATSVDQLPHHFASSYMFGHSMLIPVPDVDRTDFMLIMGANPLASNGSLMTAPGIGDRLKGIRSRGGRIVLVDPRRTETARLANDHQPTQSAGRNYSPQPASINFRTILHRATCLGTRC